MSTLATSFDILERPRRLIAPSQQGVLDFGEDFFFSKIAPLDTPIGEVFTPLPWAYWLLKQGNVLERWVQGARICDPTAGEGVFALALLGMAREKGITVTQEMLSRLVLIERRKCHLENFTHRAWTDFKIIFPSSSLICADVVTTSICQSGAHSNRLNEGDEGLLAPFDILVGNPPWVNFCDLPEDYKQMLKPYFCAEGLVPDARAMLLGSSRVDMAALICKIACSRLLSEKGEAYFFLPLSLFIGDDAHRGFRDYRCQDSNFSIEEVWEFSLTKIFPNVGTAYGCAKICKGKEQKFPVKYLRECAFGWQELRAVPLGDTSGPWRTLHPDEPEISPVSISLHPKQKPRQGINTCGVNSVFIFSEPPSEIEQEFIFPLASPENWKCADAKPRKWVFLPYDKHTGRALSLSEIQKTKSYEYLLRHYDKLANRKGTMLNAAISRGLWWSLLGVGAYSFAPYKVIWQAYGAKTFQPIVLSNSDEQPWQANQSLHAFIPCSSREEADDICQKLADPAIETLLLQLNGNGRCNWAQPGKIKKILQFCHSNGGVTTNAFR